MTTKTAVPATVTLGLFGAWLVHDLEELATLPGWTRRARPRLRRSLPAVPERVWDRLDTSRTHTTTAIGLMGVLVAAAAVSGVRTGGRGAFYQTVLDGFGWHAVGHLAQSVATRGYTPGVLTAPIVVAPFTLWARRRLVRAGVPTAPAAQSLRGLAFLPLALAAVHGTASVVERARTATENR